MNYEYERQSPMEIGSSGVESARVSFIKRTYAHLAGAVLAFAALETLLLKSVSSEQIMGIFGRSPWGVLFLMLAFWGASWMANRLAYFGASPAAQYLGLGIYIVVEAVIFLPLLHYAAFYVKDPNLIMSAGVMTLGAFAGLTLTAFLTNKDYTTLGPILSVGSLIAFGFIICSILFGFSLGLVFSFAMVVLLCGYMLYETSQVMYYWPTDKHVAAALMLFSSVATMFYYIVRILIQLNSSRD